MKQEKIFRTGDGIFSRILVSFLTLGLFLPSLIPLTSYAQVVQATSIQQDTVTPQQTTLNIPEIIVGTSTVPDLSRVDWDQTIDVGGQQMPLSSNAALQTLSNVPDDIKHLVSEYATDVAAIYQNTAASSTEQTERISEEKKALQHLIAENLIANGQLPSDYLTLQLHNQIESADSVINVNSTSSVITPLDGSAGVGVNSAVNANAVGVQNISNNSNSDLSQNGASAAVSSNNNNAGLVIKNAQDAEVWRRLLEQRLEYVQSQTGLPSYMLQEAQYSQTNLENYLLQQGYTQTLNGPITTPGGGVSLGGAMKWLLGWLMPETAQAYSFGPEDFESCTALPCSFFSKDGWGPVTSTLDTTGQVDGANSLKVVVGGEGSGVLTAQIATTTETWVQFKVWMPNPITFGPSGYFAISDLEDPSYNDLVWLDVEHDASATLTLGGRSLPYINTGLHLVAGAVNTIEMHVRMGTSTGDVDIWLNNTNQSSPSYQGSGTLDTGTSTIEYPLDGTFYAPDSGMPALYYDDFVVNNAFIGAWPNTPPTAPTNLLVEGQSNPIAVQDTTPDFSATYNDSNATDTANKYRLEVSTSSAFSSLYWDSGTVAMASTTVGNQSPNITYAGPTLVPSTNYYWRIRFVDIGKLSGAWSTATSTFTIAPSSGLSTSTTEGLTYLINDQNADGSWGSATTSFVDTAAVLDALQQFNATGTSFVNGINWLTSYLANNNDYLAQQTRLVGLATGATTTVQSLLYGLDQSTGGFVFNRGYEPDPVTTAKALQALTAVGYTDLGSNPSLTTSLALYYLTQTQNLDGEWGTFDGGVSSIPATGEVINALLPYRNEALSGFLASGTIPIANYVNSGISALQATQTASGTWENSLLDTALAFYAMESASVPPTYQNAAITYLQSAQAGNGSFGGGDPYITAKVVKALGVAPLAGAIGNPFVSNISTTTALQTGASTSLQIAITNSGTAPISSGVLQVMADEYNIASVDLATQGITISPSSTQTVTLQIPNTTGFVGVVTTTAYLEGANGAAYPNSRYDKVLTFAPDPTGLPGLPMYFVAQKSSALDLPSISIQWPYKADSNRLDYLAMWRTVGSSTWNSYASTTNGVFISGLIADQPYQVTVGALAQDGSRYVYYVNPVTVITSASSTKYATSTISGFVTAAGEAVPNIGLSGYSVLGVSDGNGNYSIGSIPYGAGALYADDFRYEPFLTGFVVTSSNLSNIKVPTLLRIDTQNPTVTNLDPFGFATSSVPNQQAVSFEYTVGDDIGYPGGTGCVQSAKFEYYDPSDTQWHLIGTQTGIICDTWTYNWTIPADLLGPGYEMRVTVQDFSGKYSTPDVYGPFTITTGNAAPTFSFTPPVAGSGSSADLDYMIKWSAWDDSTSTPVYLSYDVDTDPNNGNSVAIETAHTGDFLTQYDWNTSGIATGTYYLRGIVNDGYNTAVVVTSPPITIVHNAPTAPTSLLTQGQTNPTNVTSTAPNFTAIYNDPNSTDTATYYQAQVATSTSALASSSPIWDSGEAQLSTSTSEGSRTPNIVYAGSALAASTTYYWRIRLWDSEGDEGAWSTATSTFSIANLAPTAPTNLLANGHTNPTGVTSTPQFSATYNDPNGLDSANKYRIQVSTSSAFSSVFWDSATSTMATTTVGSSSPSISYGGSALVASTTYYWRILFVDVEGATGAWSTATSTFSMANLPPTAPTSLLTQGQTNPTGVTSTSPYFSAIYNDPNGGDSANKYHLQVSTSSAFSSVYWDSATSTMATTTVGNRSPNITYVGSALAASTTYYWRILFVDVGGSAGVWSTSTATFSLLATSTISFVQAVNNNATTTAATTTISSVGGGDLLMVEQTYTGSATTTPVTDDAGTPIFITSSTWHSTAHSYLYYEKNATSGAHHIHTVYGGTPSSPGVFVTEYSGVSTSSPLDTFSVATGTGGTMISHAMTSTIANEMAFGFGNAAGQTLTAGAGFTLRGTQAEIEDNAPSTMASGGAVSTTFSGASSSDWVVQGALINPSTWTNLAPTAPTSLLAQGQTNPTGVTSTAPTFSAIYNDPNRGDLANKYHLQVSTSSAFSSIFWDSATSTMATTTAGNRSPNITYVGSALTATTTYYWRILFVDVTGAAGAWSTGTSTFSLGIPSYTFGPESFESCGALPCSFWSYDTWGAATSSLDSTSKVDGVKSFKDVINGYGGSALTASIATTSDLWFQYKVYVPNPMTYGSSSDLGIMTFEDSNYTDWVWMGIENDGSPTLNFGGRVLPYINTGVTLTQGAVNTIEVHLTMGSSTGALSLWVNNANQASPNYSSGATLDTGTSTINYAIGGSYYAPEAGYSTLYYDDYIVNHGFIGLENFH